MQYPVRSTAPFIAAFASLFASAPAYAAFNLDTGNAYLAGGTWLTSSNFRSNFSNTFPSTWYT